VRIPAALCGVAGLKARPAALPMEGVLPLAPSMDSAGLLAPDAAGLARGWAALGGAPPPPAVPPLAVPDPPAPLEATARAAWDAVGERLGDAPEATVPAWEAWARPRTRVLLAEALAAHRERGWWPARAERYGAQARRYLELAERLSAADVRAARGELDELVAALRAAVAGGRVLALPTTVGPAPPRTDDVDAALREDGRLTLLCGPASAAGLAAVSVPAGRSDEGLPLGLQLVAETEALALGAALALDRQEALA
jgi:aspartyl-tRNA(Asn)/glutamyl-tRNA(Gln) amidotransferase subunit A